MTKFGKFKSASMSVLVFLSAGALALSQVLPVGQAISGSATSPAATSVVSPYEGKIDTGRDAVLDKNVVQSLPAGIDGDREISVIVETAANGWLSAYNAVSGVSRYPDALSFAQSYRAEDIVSEISAENGKALKVARASGAKFTFGNSYDTFFGGFELTLKAKEYEKLAAALDGAGYDVSVSEEYAVCETQVVTNDVNVHGTGIFDSSASDYDGTGTVVAVLDTGLDYTHSVFDPELFKGEEHFDSAYIQNAIDAKSLRASEFTRGLTAAKVYINPKVPYAYDYADKDPDVYPLSNEHGTHVAGIIAGNNVGSAKNKEGDPEIRGVAPNAQLAIMKVFSDTDEGARWSWIVSALEDCVKLGVDVINMSLGSSAGFSEEADERQSFVYDQISEAGISLVCAASNDYNAGFNSEKNGNLDLTSNPDSATVGSPSTYNAALSVACIDGVKTPYLKYGETIIYFTEASDKASEPKDFVNELLPADVDEKEYEYVTIPGVGRSGDYTGLEELIKGKIALVRRGNNSFEDKTRVAIQKGAAGIIIYNNVSGDISMTVGSVQGAVCSISKDNGELLAAHETGKILVSRDQTAGPFMSNFSSWGPTSDLRIKPEITAHGGEILSAVPGQMYDHLSGTSMACPNQAGVTALVRQYVKHQNPNADVKEIAATVNQLMMSTADVANNKNGLPYSVRKQGAGLANIASATSTPAYIQGYARNDENLRNGGSRFTDTVIDKAKIEYGDDPDKTGVYEMKFNVVNAYGTEEVSYDADAIIMTEGVSETRTVRGYETVTEEGYLLDGADTMFEVIGVDGGTLNGKTITVAPGKTAVVTVKITLGQEDKNYLDRASGKYYDEAGKEPVPTFENGMYVEGFITLAAKSGSSVSLSVPYLAFYGDWTQAPIFDLDYFETDRDALDASLDTDKKTLPDLYATRPIGGLSEDYISYLGSYYFIQPAGTTPIYAQREHISISNDENSINSIHSLYAGLLRNAKTVSMSVTDEATGEVIWTREEVNQRKGFGTGGMLSSIDVEFSAAEHDLKNNSRYVFKAEAALDYADGGASANRKNTFEFPFVTDYSAPVVTDCEFYTEYEEETHKTRLFARLYIYDNHYAMAMQVGRAVVPEDPRYTLDLDTFSNIPTPIYSGFNTTSVVTYELTDHLEKLKGAINENSFLVIVYDYALNEGIYEIDIPDDVRYLYFDEGEEGVTLSPNQTYYLEPHTYPEGSWKETLTYRPVDDTVVKVVGGKILALQKGETEIEVFDDSGAKLDAKLKVKVLGEGDQGFVPYDPPTVESFRLTGFTANKAFYFMSSSDRDIGSVGVTTNLSSNATIVAVSMYPSEQITIAWELSGYFPERTSVVFASDNDEFVTVDQNGRITAMKEGSGTVSINVLVDGQPTLYQRTVMVEIKNPYERTGYMLTSYRGGGGTDGTVDIGADLGANHGITEISQYAFSHYDYIPKDLEAGDVIDEDDPFYSKIWFLGENSDVRKVVIPEGVETIGPYAFAGMTGLQEVVLPSTVTMISQGAFYQCGSLTTINLDNVKFINKDAFRGTLLTSVKFKEVVGIGTNAFRGVKSFTKLDLPRMAQTGSSVAQSVGAYAFAETNLDSVVINSSKIKLDTGAFANCTRLESISINADLIPDDVFAGCTKLSDVTIGKDVQSVGVNAFGGTAVASFKVNANNENLSGTDFLVGKKGAENVLILVAPAYNGTTFTNETVTKVGEGAFSGNTKIRTVSLPHVTEVGEYAFYDSQIARVTLGELTAVGDYAFAHSKISALPAFAASGAAIGNYAFEGSSLRGAVTIPAGAEIGEGAFAHTEVSQVTIESGAKIGNSAFRADIRKKAVQDFLVNGGSRTFTEFTYETSGAYIVSLTIGEDVTVGDYAFAGNDRLTTLTLGEGTKVGDHAFYFCTGLTSLDASKAAEIGDYAFAGYLGYMAEVSFDEDLGRDAERVLGEYYGTPVSNGLTSVDLSNASRVGAYAFSFNTKLAAVTLGANTAEIGEGAFTGSPVATVNGLENVQTIGAKAFSDIKTEVVFIGEEAVRYGNALTSINLSGAKEIGNDAFSGSPSLTSVTFGESFTVGDGAFFGAPLTSAEHLSNATSVGANAFNGAKLSGGIDLSKATKLGDAAFLGNGFTSVQLSSALKEIGDNPFAGNPIPLFASEKDVFFNGVKVGTEPVSTYEISETVKVIDGVLYKKVPNGYVLVTYPIGAAATSFKVAEGEQTFEGKDAEGNAVSHTETVNVVRIAANAFRGSKLSSVELPRTLASIGDKAFFECDNLRMVTFKSVRAPVLEEQYDEEYTEMPGSHADEDDADEGNLGIIKYRMWVITSANIFYGANFVDYVGKADGSLAMVRPRNGENYDSFVYGKYFGTVIDGAAAPRQATLDAIAAIDALPGVITLDCEAAVENARALYNLIIETEQQALVTNYGKLTAAESTILFLKRGQNTPSTPIDPEPTVTENDPTVIVLAVFVGVFGAATVALLAVTLLRGKKKAPEGPAGEDKGPAQENEDPSSEDTAEEPKNGADDDE